MASRETPFYARDITELEQGWFFFMSAGARCAWDYLKGYVKTTALSQKNPNRAPRLDPEVAAHRWRVTPDEVRELESAAIKAGKLTIEGDQWVVTDRLIFQSEKTAERYAARQTTPNEPNVEEPAQEEPNGGVCRDLSDKPGKCGPLTGTETETVDQPTVDDLAREPVAGIPVTEPSPGALTVQDGAEYWALAREPMRSVGLCLCRVNDAAGAGPPSIKLVERHVGANQPCRQLVDAIGWERSADLFNWCAKHLEGARSWTTVWGNYAGYLQQMDNGVSRVPKNSSPSLPARTETVQQTIQRRQEAARKAHAA